MKEKYINQIEAYFRKTLTAEEHLQFEEAVRNNPELRKIFDEYRLGMEMVDTQVEYDLKTRFDIWEKENKKNKIRRITILISAAASILLLIGLYFTTNPFTISNEKTAFRFYHLPDAPGIRLGDVNELWTAGLAAYQNKDFEKAIESWSAVEIQDSETAYYLAHCYFNEKEFNKAIPLFKELSAGTSIYKYPSEWFLTLAYLASDKTDLFKTQLNRILKEKNHPYYQKAQKLSAKVDKQIL